MESHVIRSAHLRISMMVLAMKSVITRKINLMAQIASIVQLEVR
jgi:hypothetical protein